MNQPAKKSVAGAMERLAERYPLDRYVWIMPKLETAGALPEHLDFAVKTRKFSARPEDKDVYPVQGGGVALTKNALMALAADAGIKWIPGMNRRIDDGSNPDIVEWQATGILAGLSGMTPVTATKRIDLALYREKEKASGKGEKDIQKNDFQRREFKVEMAETKAQLRVIRAILGIPGSFQKSTIEDKEFAVLQVIFNPKPHNSEERILILERTMQTYLGAYPGAEMPQIGGTAERPHQIAPEQVRRALPEAAPVDNEHQHHRTIEEPLYTEAELVDEDSEAEDEKPPVNYEFLKLMRGLKDRLVKRLGKEGGEREYYFLLNDHGYQKSNEIIERAEQANVYRALTRRVRLIESNVKDEGAATSKAEDAGSAEGEEAAPVTHEKEEDSPYQFLLDARRKAFNKMSLSKLQAELESLAEGYDYDEDPLGLKGVETKEDMIEAALKLVEDSIIRTAIQKRGGRS